MGPTGLIVQQTESRLVISAPERFRLVFERAYEWQPVGWFDLASDPERNLVSGTDRDPSLRLLQGLLVRPANEWLRMTMGTDRAIAVEQPDLDHVRVITAWRWAKPPRVVDASIVHVIAADGTWMLDTTVSDPTGDPAPIDAEYADAHVTLDLEWDSTASEPSYEFVARDIDPAPALRVTRTNPLGTLSSDEPNNAYWAIAGASLPLSLSWTVSIWRPELANE
jgi:hypothetical protein